MLRSLALLDWPFPTWLTVREAPEHSLSLQGPLSVLKAHNSQTCQVSLGRVFAADVLDNALEVGMLPLIFYLFDA